MDFNNYFDNFIDKYSNKFDLNYFLYNQNITSSWHYLSSNLNITFDINQGRLKRRSLRSQKTLFYFYLRM